MRDSSPTPPSPTANVGNRVRAARVRQLLTQEELALASGVARATIARLEGGTGQPRMATIRAIADALEVPASDLVPDPESLWGPDLRLS